jgi:hypothetical protein
MTSMSPLEKVRLAGRVWSSYIRVHWALRREPLPRAAELVGTAPSAWWGSLAPLRLSRTVHRVLHIGPWRPRCLIGSMVLYRLLRSQGTDAELVIGLPDHAEDHEAHAWVEVDGGDVGPPPGRGAHRELVRYPS